MLVLPTHCSLPSPSPGWDKNAKNSKTTCLNLHKRREIDTSSLGTGIIFVPMIGPAENPSPDLVTCHFFLFSSSKVHGQDLVLQVVLFRITTFEIAEWVRLEILNYKQR